MFEDPALALGLYGLGNTHTYTHVHHIQRHMPKKIFFKHKHGGGGTVRVMKGT